MRVRAPEWSPAGKNVFNLGHDEFMNVKDLAAVVIEELGLRDVRFRFTGGRRGWLGGQPGGQSRHVCDQAAGLEGSHPDRTGRAADGPVSAGQRDAVEPPLSR